MYLYIFVLKLGTRVKCMFVRFFMLTSLIENSGLFSVLEGEIQLIFLLFSYFLGLYNYRKLPKKLVRNRKKDHFLKSYKAIRRTGNLLLNKFFI